MLLADSLRISLAAMWFCSAAMKLRSLNDFVDATRTLLSPAHAPGVAPVARVWPLIEVALAASLVTNASARWSALASSLVLVLLTFILVRAHVQRLMVGCYCFGRPTHRTISRFTVLRTASLAALAISTTVLLMVVRDQRFLLWQASAIPEVVTLGLTLTLGYLMLAVTVWLLTEIEPAIVYTAEVTH